MSVTTLVVQDHPLSESYSAALRGRVVEALERRGRPHEVFRLGQGERPTVDDVAGVGRLILVYPTWSGGIPARLLDWLHEVLDRPACLADVDELVAVTSCGSSRLINRIQGEWGKRYLASTVLGRCRAGARFRWVPLYKIDRLDRPATATHLGRIDRRLGLGGVEPPSQPG